MTTTAEYVATVHDPIHVNHVSRIVLDCAYRVHTALGPGLLESAYEACLAWEIRQAGLHVDTQVPLPLLYQSVHLDVGYRLDLLLDRCVIVELKAVEAIAPVHEAQLLSHLKLSGVRLGLLITFNVARLKEGIRRLLNNF